jgi:hypothetical protein
VRRSQLQLRAAGLGGALILSMAIGATAQETAAGCAEVGLREAPAPVRERRGWTAPRKIVVRGDEAFVRTLQSVAPGVELVPAANHEAAVRASRRRTTRPPSARPPEPMP